MSRDHTVLLAACLGNLMVLAPVLLLAGESVEGVRALCDPQDPEQDCPGARCLCSDDAFEIVFSPSSTNVLDLAGPRAGQKIAASVILDTRSEGVSGWSYGVEHDAAFLTIVSATTDGTDGDAARQGGFLVTAYADIETCRNDPDPRCPNPEPGTGFVSAGTLSFVAPATFAVRRNSVAHVEYAIAKSPGSGGTRLEFVDHLRVRGSSQSEVMLTIAVRSVRPHEIIDGILRSTEVPPVAFRRGDFDSSGTVSIADAVGLLGYLFLGLNEPSCLDAGDADDDGILRTNDAVVILGYLFLGTRAPLPPGPLACGVDPTGEEPELGCANACR